MKSGLSLVQHAYAIALLVVSFLEVVVVDQHARAKEDGLHPHVEVHGKADAEDVGIGERLLENARPLFADLPDLVKE